MVRSRTPEVRVPKQPRYTYTCSKCGGSVTKPALIRLKDKDDAKAARLGLGSWRCPKDGPVKVNRTLNKPEEK